MFKIKLDRSILRKSLYLPIVIGLTVSGITLIISASLKNKDNSQIQQIIQTKIVSVKEEIINQLDHRISAVEQMAKRWEERGGTPKHEWEADAKALIRHQRGYQTIEWVDSDYYVRWIIPKQGNEVIINLNAGFEPKRREALETAKNLGSVTITRPVDLMEGDKGFLAYFPLFIEQEFDGFILAVFKIQPLLDHILQEQHHKQYGLTIYDEDKVIYNTVSPDWELEHWGQEETFELYGVEWRIKAVPSPELLASVYSPLPDLVRVIGLILSWILALVVHLAQTAQNRTQQLEKTKQILQKTLRELNLQKLALDRSAMVEIIDPEGKITYVNDRGCQILQYSRPEIIGKTHRLVNSGYHSSAFFQELWSTITSGNVWQGEIKNRAKDGSCYWVDTTIVPFFDSQNQPLKYLTIRFDITKSKQAQEKLKEQNSALLEAKEQAEAANRAKSEFLATMSHELRTPLNGILGFTQILQKEPNLTPTQYRHLDNIRQSGQHLLTLINDILDLSKIAAKKLKLQPQDFLFVDFLDNLAIFSEQSAQRKSLSFNYQLLSDLPKAVQGDETRLRQVLINLLGNAVKFTKTGSVTFKVGYVENEGDREDKGDKGDKEEISQSSINNQKIRFQVEDTGVGIPSDKLEAIFSPFEQLRNNLGNQEGTGLGLAISHNLVQLMGSQINIKSTPGKGSIFWFDIELPSVKADHLHTPTQNKPQPIGFSGSSRKILVVDDNINNRLLLVNCLQPLGFEIAEAENGQEGLIQAEFFAPDVILLDLRMPVMDGQEMLDRLRQHPDLKNTIVFMISANSQLILKPEEINCHAFLPKPVVLEKLLELLETHLNLEWIFSESDTESKFNSSENTLATLSSEDSTAVMVAPPESELIELLNLTTIGDIEAIEERIECIKALDSQYTAFVKEAQQLAATCQQQKLEGFLKNFVAIK